MSACDGDDDDTNNKYKSATAAVLYYRRKDIRPIWKKQKLVVGKWMRCIMLMFATPASQVDDKRKNRNKLSLLFQEEILH